MTSPRAGFTFVELIIVMGIVAVLIMMFSNTVAAVSRQRSINRENAIAADAAQAIIEAMRNRRFEDVFALYNSDLGDDPDGPGTAPGHRFAVENLRPTDDSPDGLIGEVSFPAVNVAAAFDPIDLELREDLVDAAMGTPRDLSGDSIIDGEDHTDDYFVLPVSIQLRWTGKSGIREFQTFTTLGEFNWL